MSKYEITKPIQTSMGEKLKVSTQKRKKSIIKDQSPSNRAEIGRIANTAKDMFVTSLNRPKIMKNDLEAIKNRTIEYLEYCSLTGAIPTMEGLAVSFGVTRKTLYLWLNDYSNPKIIELMESIRDVISDANAQAAMKRKIDVTSWIFYSKNRYGMQDKSELEIVPHDPLGALGNPEEIAARQQRLTDGIAQED